MFGVNYERTPSLTATPTIAGFPQLPEAHQSAIPSSRSQQSHGNSTIDSGDLEWCIRENTALVPSYSEALLIDNQEEDHTRRQNETSNNRQMATTSSSYSIRASASSNNNNITNSDCQNQGRGNNTSRRSWGSVLNFQPRPTRSTSQGLNQPDNLSRSSTQNRLVLYYPSSLVEVCPEDPFHGRAVTTPTDESPPSYEEALRFPALTRLRRSLTDRGEICRRAFFTQRRSCYAEPSHSALYNEIRINQTQPRGRTLITMETSL